MHDLLVLIPEDCDKNKPTKILDKDLKKIKSFDAGFNFYFETIGYENFHDILQKIFKNTNCFIVLGELNEYGKSFEETEKCGPRRYKKGEPTIQERNGPEIVLDLDDHILDKFNPCDPELAIRIWLEEKEIDCDVTWQITSGQKLNTEEARIRLYFQCNTSYSLLRRKAWSQKLGCDGSVYTCSQPIYTAPPEIQESDDPIINRTGFIEQRERLFELPKLSEPDVKKFSSHTRGGDGYDFTDPNLPEDVLSGKVYRRYFMPLAFHYANLLKNDREAIFAIIEAKSSMVKSREFSPENTYAYIDDAISKISSEVPDEIITTRNVDKDLKALVPKFPDDVMEDWPDPWPMIWENFKKVPRETVPALLVPTVLSLNSHFLGARFVTEYGRRPNMFFLNLTPSTGHKDVNSRNVIRDLDLLMKKNGGALKSIFSGLSSNVSNITSDTAFLQSFSDENNFLWVNTEATRIFQQLKNAQGNSSVMALSDKMIEVVDGHEISGKNKSGNKISTINDPNCQILFYAQPETIEQCIDMNMVDSGLFGRSLLSIIPDLKFDPGTYDMFITRTDINLDMDCEFIDFYKSDKFNVRFFEDNKTVLSPTDNQKVFLREWAREYVAPLMSKDDSMQKVLSRIGNSIEQLYCIVLGICRVYDDYNGCDIRESIDVSCLIPLVEYWVDAKIYAIENYIDYEMDILASSMIEIVEKYFRGEYKYAGIADKKCVEENSVVPKNLIFKKLRENKKLLGKLDIGNEKKDVTNRLNNTLNSLVKMEILYEKNVKVTRQTKCCIGLNK